MLKETKAPEGYQLNPDVIAAFVCISSDLKKDEVDAYRSAGLQIINSGYQEFVYTVADEKIKDIDIPVEKIWDDNDNAAQKRPTSVTVTLHQKTGSDKLAATDKTLTLHANAADANKNWKGVFTKLQTEDSGYTADAFRNYNVPNQDAGYVYEYTRSLEGTLWNDGDKTTADGARGDDEPVFADTEVKLQKLSDDRKTYEDVMVNGEPLTATTDENGHFVFTNLEPGTYQVVIAGEEQVTYKDKAGVPEDKDSEAVNVMEESGKITGAVITGIYLPTNTELYEGSTYRADENRNYNVPN